MPLGGNWAEAGRTGVNGFKVKGGLLERATVSDADLYSGAYGLAGATVYTTVKVQVTCGSTPVMPTGSIFNRNRVLARYVDVNNWIMACVYRPATGQQNGLVVVKRLAGVATTLATIPLAINVAKARTRRSRSASILAASGRSGRSRWALSLVGRS